MADIYGIAGKIATFLQGYFPDTAVYREQVPQDFIPPAFCIKFVASSSTDITWFYVEEEHTWEIEYFPDLAQGDNRLDKMGTLKDLFMDSRVIPNVNQDIEVMDITLGVRDSQVYATARTRVIDTRTQTDDPVLQTVYNKIERR